MVPQPSPRPIWAGRTVAVLGILLVALSLRLAVSSISPIIAAISEDIPLSSVGVGLLGMLPPMFFAVSGLIAPPIARRVGLEKTLVLAIVAMVLGHLLRAFSDSYAVLFVGTSLALVGAGIGNVLLPPAVKRYFPDRIGLMTSTYATVMSISTALGAISAAPIAESFGWRYSLGVWSVLATAALVPWMIVLARHRQTVALAAAAAAATVADVADVADAAEPELERIEPAIVAGLWRSPVAWAITLTFAVSSLNAYAAFAWLPQILTQTAGVTSVEAGILLALFSFAGFPASIVAPYLVTRLRNPGWIIQAGVVFFITGYLGLIFAPATLTWLWVFLIGLGPILFPVCLVLFNTRSRTHEGAVALSGFAQGIGYTVGALGPLVVGVLHDISGSWTAPLVFLLATSLAAIISGMAIAKSHFIEDDLARIAATRAD